MSTIFEQIANRELPARVVWENDTHMAFLSIGPVAPGHTLVVPKHNQGDYVFELNDTEYQELLQHSKYVARILKEKLGCTRVVMHVEGFEVPHVHVHLIPVTNEDSLMAGKIIEMTDEQFDAVHAKLTS